MSPTEAKYRDFCESRLAITLAGCIAARRAEQGSAPCWHRLRSQKSLVAFHEAGHGVVAAAVAFNVHRVFMVPASESGLVERFAGACVSSLDVDDPLGTECPHPSTMVRDSRKAAELCIDLARLDSLMQGCSEPAWKRALAYYRKAQARAREIIDRHWYACIALADELERRGDLDRCDVAGVLAHSGL